MRSAKSLILLVTMVWVQQSLAIAPLPTRALVNPNASPEAQGLMNYLGSVYGNHVLSGHQASYDWNTANDELNKIKNWTNESPAVRGFDFMDVINSWGAPHARNALDWAKTQGGIVTLCWHWRLGGKSFYSDRDDRTQFPSGAPETNATINADLKKLGDELQKFSDAKIPVLWRPLHEPPGNWFWWHTAGAEQYKRLWIHMYKYLVNERKLNNLIWVYSGADNGGYKDKTWYPGNEYVDIVGVDGYGANWQTYWNGLATLSGGGTKMQAMTENKAFPPWNTSSTWLYTLCWNNEIFNALASKDFTGHYNGANTYNLDNLPTYQAKANWAQLASGVTSRATRNHLFQVSPSTRLVRMDGSPVDLTKAELNQVIVGTRPSRLAPGMYFLRSTDQSRQIPLM